MNSKIFLNPQELEVARRVGESPESIMAQKRNPIFGASLHGASGPKKFPLKSYADDIDGNPDPRNTLGEHFPIRPRAEGEPAPDDDEDSLDDDGDQAKKDPLGLKRKRVGVSFPNGKRI